MARRKIKRRRGEGISISGPATVHVSRSVTLVIDAPREARIARLGTRGKAVSHTRRQKPGPEQVHERRRNHIPPPTESNRG